MHRLADEFAIPVWHGYEPQENAVGNGDRGKSNLWGKHPSTTESLLMRYSAKAVLALREDW